MYSYYIEQRIDSIIELVRNSNKTFEPVKVREVRKLINDILAAHENQILAQVKESPKVLDRF